MAEISIRVDGAAGRITLQRPAALNALTAAMIPMISEALDAWAENDAVTAVIFDAEGDKAFCAGGDIADLYAAGRAGDFDFGRKFWADEYRLNAQIAEFPKPTFSFLQGFTMGGGVGIGCHCRHRIVGDTSQIAMPECGIGLIPDVGGSLILATAPGHLGEYLGLTGARMGPGAAIHAGFADHYLPEAEWPALKAAIIAGDLSVPERDAPPHDLPAEIDAMFDAPTLGDLVTRLDATDTAFANHARKALMRASPLSMAAALLLIRSVRQTPAMRSALTQEYRFTWRASEEGDFLEGIRAAIIDKDRTPKWRHSLTNVTEADAIAMLAPVAQDLTWET
ncbi:MAG: enoyl-CoA hydratase/isomerase family protein [Pseudomonadota bacterium]